MSFLVDTDTCSAFIKGVTMVTTRFIQYGGRLHISTVTLGELYAWTLRAKASAKRMQSLLALLHDVQVIPLDEAAAHKFGEIRAWQLDQGFANPGLDLLNAAIALVHNHTVVTHNVQDYANIPGLTVQDWLAP